jgi:hypothetical protein
LTLAAYVSKDGLVGHHWKERPIGQANFICPSTGERQGQKKKWEAIFIVTLSKLSKRVLRYTKIALPLVTIPYFMEGKVLLLKAPWTSGTGTRGH